MSNMMMYTFDLPHITRSATDRNRVYVEYSAFNNYHSAPICRYKGAEFPCTSYKVSTKVRYRLSTFIIKDELPLSWGQAHQQVKGASPSFFDTTMEKISYLNLDRQLKWSEPNLREALSWPLGKPTFSFFKLSQISSYEYHWEEKCTFATLVMRCGDGEQLDDSLVNMYKKIDVELAERDIFSGNFTGQNIEKEIAYVQLIRMMTALPYDYRESEFHSSLFQYVLDLYRVISPSLLGNRKWNPQSTWNNSFTELSFDTDSDLDDVGCCSC
ncbi:nonstructural protein [Tres Almendras virus]|uniref:Nonstructural protein n=1 Tax=Tres Almendras virus TaxID=2559114 RepID=A0A482KAS6_9VIRU|nr:nonstructural protein [Tres Almendras virus]QBQ01770.1 nonstructural protein [Tres Almendras virus]